MSFSCRFLQGSSETRSPEFPYLLTQNSLSSAVQAPQAPKTTLELQQDPQKYPPITPKSTPNPDFLPQGGRNLNEIIWRDWGRSRGWKWGKIHNSLVVFPFSLGRSDDVKCHKPVPVCTDMKMHVCNFSLKTVVLEKVLKKFRGGQEGFKNNPWPFLAVGGKGGSCSGAPGHQNRSRNRLEGNSADRCSGSGPSQVCGEGNVGLFLKQF